MPVPGMRWYHLVLHTHGSWLHGDPRGFRSRKHRIHSSGDYKNPPPVGEHAALHDAMKRVSASAIKVPDSLCPYVGRGLLKKIASLGYRCLAISVGATHTHLLLELPDDYTKVKRISGQLKQAASHHVRDKMPGKLWAGGGKPIEVNDSSHQQRVYAYILRHRREGDWTWSQAPHIDAVESGAGWWERGSMGDQELDEV